MEENYQIILLHITNKCNLSCDFCYMNSFVNKQTPSIDNIVKYVRRYTELNNNTKYEVVFHGGEPMTLGINFISELILKLKSFISKFGIQTNMSLMGDDWIELFKREKVRVGSSYNDSGRENFIDDADTLVYMIMKTTTEEDIDDFFESLPISIKRVNFETYKPVSKKDFDSNAPDAEYLIKIYQYIRENYSNRNIILRPFDVPRWLCYDASCGKNYGTCITFEGKTYGCNYIASAFPQLYIYDLEKDKFGPAAKIFSLSHMGCPIRAIVTKSKIDPYREVYERI